MNRSRLIVACFVMIATFDASAYVEDVVFSPAIPSSSQAITVSLTTGACHSVAYPDATVVINGSTMDVIFDGVYEIFNDFCNLERFEYSGLNVGTVPAGNYTVNIRIRSISAPFTLSPPAATLPLTVLGGAPPTPIPTWGVWAMVVALLLLIALGLQRLKA